jgi:hypothetical protein
MTQAAALQQSVHARLVCMAKDRAVDPNLILTRYAAERLLYRLSQSLRPRLREAAIEVVVLSLIVQRSVVQEHLERIGWLLERREDAGGGDQRSESGSASTMSCRIFLPFMTHETSGIK